MVITDLDGTLLGTGGAVSATNLATLADLGRQHILRVIATGRSLYSARRVLDLAFPIDYLIFSSGAGIMDWHTQRLLAVHHLSEAEITAAVNLLIAHELDFMIHHPIPDNHYCAYRATGQANPDFVRRQQRYQAFSAPLNLTASGFKQASQLLAIDPRHGAQSEYDLIKAQLPMLKVIRSTSPTDGVSTWIEIFPPAVSKGLASAWLARKHAVAPAAALAVGNDYNDLDLLQWAGHRFVVGNAPADLKHTYCAVRSNDDDGFTEAVTLWRKRSSL